MSGTNPLPAGQWANIAQLGSGNMSQGSNGSVFQQGASNARPLRGPPASNVRQPYLGQAPLVSNAVGFGTGSGAGIVNQGSDADQSQGLVAIKVGLNPLTTTTLVLFFPVTNTTGQYVFLGDWFSSMSVNIVSGLTYLTIGGMRPLVTGETLLLAYQWAVSQ